MKRFLMISICFVFIISLCGCGDVDPATEIFSDIRSLSLTNYGTNYAIGKVKSSPCKVIEQDGHGRYVIQCEITYNPKLNNGATDLSQEMKETVIALYMNIDSDTYARAYGSVNKKESLKQSFCWGKDKSYGHSCN